MARQTVCSIEELPVGSHVVVALNGRASIGVFNVNGTLVGVLNACPHAGAPLCRGALTGTAIDDGGGRRRWAHEGEILKCPWHGWEFKLPEAVTVSDPPVFLKTFPVTVEDGQVIVETRPARERAA